jgi:hypothetical protein
VEYDQHCGAAQGPLAARAARERDEQGDLDDPRVEQTAGPDEQRGCEERTQRKRVPQQYPERGPRLGETTEEQRARRQQQRRDQRDQRVVVDEAHLRVPEVRREQAQHQAREGRHPEAEVSQGQEVEGHDGCGTEQRRKPHRCAFNGVLATQVVEGEEQRGRQQIERRRPNGFGAVGKAQVGIEVQAGGIVRQGEEDAAHVVVGVRAEEVDAPTLEHARPRQGAHSEGQQEDAGGDEEPLRPFARHCHRPGLPRALSNGSASRAKHNGWRVGSAEGALTRVRAEAARSPPFGGSHGSR